MRFGWFYDGHSALADCEACIALLSRTLPASGRRVMTAVREAALQEDFLICAVDAPYEKREVLKKRGYRWRPPEQPNGKVWWTTTNDSKAETAWLRSEVYGHEAQIPCFPVTALDRFSERLWDRPS